MKVFESSPIKKLLFGVMKLAKKDIERQFSRAGVKVSHLQYLVLAKLPGGPKTLNEIARQLGIKPPSLIPAVDTLEKAAYLLRRHDKSDRRKIQLIITKSGLEEIKKIPCGNKAGALNKAFSKLSPAKQKQLLENLQELTANFPVK